MQNIDEEIEQTTRFRERERAAAESGDRDGRTERKIDEIDREMEMRNVCVYGSWNGVRTISDPDDFPIISGV